MLFAHFKFKNVWTNNKIVSKDVDWYLMKKIGGHLIPQKEEGFVESKFIHVDKVDELIKYKDEKEIIITRPSDKSLNIIPPPQSEPSAPSPPTPPYTPSNYTPDYSSGGYRNGGIYYPTDYYVPGYYNDGYNSQIQFRNDSYNIR